MRWRGGCRAPVLLALCAIALPRLAAAGPQALGDGPIASAASAVLLLAVSPEAPPPARSSAPRESAAPAKHGAIRLVWSDRPSLRIGSLFRVDARLRVQEDLRGSEQDLSSIGGRWELTRVRGGVKGYAFKVIEYEVDRELRTGGPWRDVFLNVRALRGAQLQGGQFKIPFGREHLTSVYELDFVYRSLISESLAPGRDVGAMAHGRLFGRLLAYQAGIFRGRDDNLPTLQAPAYFREGEALAPYGRTPAARIVVAPFARWKDSILGPLEIGAGALSGDIPEGPNTLQGHSVFGQHIVRRGPYVNGRRLRVGADASWSRGPASFAAEYIQVREQRRGLGVGSADQLDNDLPDLVPRGWYVSGTWKVLGARRSGAGPKRSVLEGGAGMIEIAARIEEIRFGTRDTGEAPSTSPRAANVVGNRERVATVGVNWSPHRLGRIQFNLLREAIDDVSTSPVPGKGTFLSAVCRFQFAM